MINQQLIGVVLCGGRSSRMGTDKALLKVDDTLWVERTIQLFSDIDLSVVLSLNTDQQAIYRHQTFIENIVIDSTNIDVKGPLLGILSVHETYPHKDLFVMACDLPNMNSKVLKELCKQYSQQQGKQVYAFINDESYEPLCAIYTSGGLTRIADLQRKGQLQKFSMKYVLETIDTAIYPLPDGWKPYFINVNTQEDLANMQLKR